MGFSLWGRAPRRLQKAVDAVERARGFEPPVFVDVRTCRNARASGLGGAAFERLVGKNRYRWVKAPEQAESVADLLELALDAAETGRRMVLLGSATFPLEAGRVVCSRYTLGTLLLEQARKYDLSLDVVEWPGGHPRDCALPVSDGELDSVARGKPCIELGEAFDVTLATIPWGSTAILRSDGRDLRRVVGPARGEEVGWTMPVLWPRWPKSPESEVCHRQARTICRSLGLEARGTDQLIAHRP
jgi:hypothetical protein